MNTAATGFQAERRDRRVRTKTVGGVSTVIRRSARPHPLHIERGCGSRTVDVGGSTYIDYGLGWGLLRAPEYYVISQGGGAVFQLSFMERPARNYRDTLKAYRRLYSDFALVLLTGGVFVLGAGTSRRRIRTRI